MSDFYNQAGEPLTLVEWGRAMSDTELRIIGQEHVGDHWVSTVWLGLDHNWMPEGPPLIFETMVFCRHEPECDLDNETWRYSTRAEACEGHAEAVEHVRALT